MAEQFSHVAADYDSQFTHTQIGKYQRGQVLREVEPMLKKHWNALEVNCGTGEDALWLADRVKSVLATDISPEMVAVAKKKSTGKTNVNFAVLDLNQMESLAPQTFDLIFSNFGGLNCLSPEELERFIRKSLESLNPGGLLMLVIMGRKTWWERLYFTLKGDKKSAQRRNTSEPLLVNVNETNVATWYYSPKDILRLADAHFEVLKIRPVGLFVPPSYMQQFFANKKWGLQFLSFLDRLRPARFADYADHYLICLEKKAA